MTEFITRNYANKDFEIIIKTDNKEHYKAAEDFARKLIDHVKPQANADRIRAMSDEELADFMDDYEQLCEGRELTECIAKNCKECILKWLQQPAKENDNGK